MNPLLSRFLVIGTALLGGITSVPAVAADEEAQSKSWTIEVAIGDPSDPFSALPTIVYDDLETLRGGDITATGEDDIIINSFNTDASSHAETNANAQFDNVTVHGDVLAGSVNITGNAMGNFRGVVTQSFGTAPGVNVTAQTALSFTLMP